MFARVLEDIDMLSPIPDHLLVERPKFAFVAGVEYEWLPPFCSHCKMIGHELAQCRVIHDQGRVPGPQRKPSQKTTFDEWEQGRTAIPKLCKEYQKKDPQPKLVEGPTDKLKIDAPGGAKAGSLLGHLAFDKKGGGEDDFADMPPLEDASDHDRSPSRQGLSTRTSDFPEPGMLRNSPATMQANDSESHSVTTSIDDHHVEVSDHVTVPSLSPHTSPQKTKYFGDVKALSLVLQNHFSSLDGLETTNVVSKFWVDPNEMKEDASDTREK